MLAQRVLTALILIPLVLAAVWYLPTPWVTLLFAIVLLLGAWEWSALMPLRKPALRAAYVLLVAALAALAWLALRDASLTTILLCVGVIWWVLAFAWILVYPAGLHEGEDRILLKAVVGVAVLVPSIPAVALLHASGPLWLLLLFVIIWAADTGAYFAGRGFGKRKLAPRVSPGKTWEGLAGGLLAAVLLSLAAAILFGLIEAGYLRFALCAAIVVAFSVVGDLTESMFKRHAEIKDSGGIFPGHGGVLDRLDSMLAGAPVLVLLIRHVLT